MLCFLGSGGGGGRGGGGGPLTPVLLDVSASSMCTLAFSGVIRKLDGGLLFVVAGSSPATFT